MDGLKGRRKRGITAPSTRMEPLKQPVTLPQQGRGFSPPSPVSPAAHIRTYKRRGIGGRKGGS